MKVIFSVIFLLSFILVSTAFAQPDGSSQRPLFQRQQQGAGALQGTFTCDTSSDTLLTEAQIGSCRAVTVRNIGTNTVYICAAGITATTSACGIYLNQNDPYTYDKSLKAGALTCITAAGTSIVHYHGECG
jgi:hypothetical protein